MNIRAISSIALILLISNGTGQAIAAPAQSGLDQIIATSKKCEEALGAIQTFMSENAAFERAKMALKDEIQNLPDAVWLPGYCQGLKDNLASKLISKSEGVNFSDVGLINTAIKYEAFRIMTFRNAGVSPKRYFGFLDERGKTAAYERTLKTVATQAAHLLNDYAEKNKLDVSLTAKEIIVTQLAEGGALLLTSKFEDVNSVHPVKGVGLDDYRAGFQHFPSLVHEADQAFGTDLQGLSDGKDGGMSFTETVLGTAIMYLYEKQITENKRLAEGRASLKTLSLDEQFVHTSLVYNSGLLFSDERVAQMMSFDTGAYLVDISERTANRLISPRPKLPVILPAAADTLLAGGETLPNQPVSWNAVYHVMQRYGAWVALSKFSNYFTSQGEVAPLKQD